MKKLLTTASVLVGLTISFKLLANSGIHLDLKQCSLANSYDNILDMVYEY
jgi:hypothetical protein